MVLPLVYRSLFGTATSVQALSLVLPLVYRPIFGMAPVYMQIYSILTGHKCRNGPGLPAAVATCLIVDIVLSSHYLKRPGQFHSAFRTTGLAGKVFSPPAGNYKRVLCRQ